MGAVMGAYFCGLFNRGHEATVADEEVLLVSALTPWWTFFEREVGWSFRTERVRDMIAAFMSSKDSEDNTRKLEVFVKVSYAVFLWCYYHWTIF